MLAVALWPTATHGEEPGPDFEKIEPGRTVILAAPVGTTPDILGMGYDEHLSDTDATGKTLRVYPAKARHVAENQYFAQFEQLDSAFKLNAHANLLFAAMGAGVSNEKRYVVLKIYSLQATETLVQESEPAVSASLVAQRIYLGWAMNVVFEGDANSFTAEAAVDLMKGGAGIETTVRHYNLRKYVHLVGLEPKAKGSIPVVLDESKINELFEVAQQPVPIFVEYKVIKDIYSPKISWERGGFKPGQYRLTSIRFAVAKTKENGKAWDVLGGRPDPFITVMVDGASVDTCLQQDTFEGTCTGQKVVTLTERSMISMSVEDKDLEVNDPIGSVAPVNVFATGRPYVELELQTTGQLQRATVTLVPVGGTPVAKSPSP